VRIEELCQELFLDVLGGLGRIVARVGLVNAMTLMVGSDFHIEIVFNYQLVYRVGNLPFK
jgi:hypothetical protein